MVDTLSCTVVSCSDGFGTTGTGTPVGSTMSINFVDESVRAGSGLALLWNSFIRRRRLHDFSSRNVFITTLFYLHISPLLQRHISLKYIFVRQ